MPFKIRDYLGDSGKGTVYFEDNSQHEIVVFDADNETVISDRHPKRHVTHALVNKASLSIQHLSRGLIVVDYSIPRATRSIISLISLNGQEVKQLHSGTLEAGTRRKTYSFSSAPGVYPVCLRTSLLSRASRIVAK